MCIDEPEFRLATQDKHTDIQELAENKLNSLIDCKKFMITLGKKVVFYLKIVLKNQSCQHLQIVL